MILYRVSSFLSLNNTIRFGSSKMFGTFRSWNHLIRNKVTAHRKFMPGIYSNKFDYTLYSYFCDSGLSTTRSDNQRDPKGVVKMFEVLHTFIDSTVLYTACELKVFDYIHSCDKENPNLRSAKLVANHIGADEQATEVLLDYLVTLDMLTKQGAVYKLTKESDHFLTSHQTESMVDYAPVGQNILYQTFSNLQHGILEGMPQIHRTLGSQLEESMARTFPIFLKMMHTTCTSFSPFLSRAFDLSKFTEVLDMGGGTGGLAYDLSSLYPHMSISVLDLPPVVNFSAKFTPHDVEQRKIKFIEGDFLVDDMPPCDLVILSQILHNWKDDKVNIILKKAYDACRPGGALLIGDTILEENPRETPIWKMRKSLMMMLTIAGGRERRRNEFENLLKHAGFSDLQFKYSDGAFVDAIFARKYQD